MVRVMINQAVALHPKLSEYSCRCDNQRMLNNEKSKLLQNIEYDLSYGNILFKSFKLDIQA